MKKIVPRLITAICLLMLAGIMNQVRFSQTYPTGMIDARVAAAPATPTINLVLGGFRGVVADWLWVRAMILQDQGRFIEMVQLAEWITALQPQFVEIWTMHAWNLSYNISVLLPSGEERWRWVRHGYEILRDQAIPATRYHPRICTELAWILMHKIAGTSDDFSDTYFTHWFDLYTPLLEPDGSIPQDPARKTLFTKETGLPPSVIARFETSFGPHDWRHPMTHAAAWAFAGMVLHPNHDGVHMANRLFIQTYRSLFLQGRISPKPTTAAAIELTPDMDRLDGVLHALKHAYELSPHPGQNETYLLTMKRIIQELVAYGRNQEARTVYALLVDSFPDAPGARNGFLSIAATPVTIPPRTIRIKQQTP